MTESPADPATLHDIRLAIIGCGSMAEAMLAGLLAKGLIQADHVRCSHPREERRHQLEQRYGVSCVAGNADALPGADVVLLGVKPQVLPQVLPELRSAIDPGQLIVSIIAGATTRALATGLGHADLVRAMPNTPSQIGRGVSVWYATPSVSEQGRTRARTMLGALGIEIEVTDERQVAMATALSGTGPTYIFLFVEALIDAGVHMGFARHVARDLVLGTLMGSAEFASRAAAMWPSCATWSRRREGPRPRRCTRWNQAGCARC